MEDDFRSEVGLSFTGEEFRRQQALGSRHVTFSLTEACPLRCAHCAVETFAPSARGKTMSMDDAAHYANEMPALFRRGVRLVSFTGGEPMLAARQLALLSAAAASAGLVCAVVTAAHWAVDDASTARVIERYPGITDWQISADVYHEPFVPHENAVRAAWALHARGKRTMVRMAASLPIQDDHRALRAKLRRDLPRDVPIYVQPVTFVGRAEGLDGVAEAAAVPTFPCTPSGLFVRHDATMAPCCSGLANERDDHPFQFGSARDGLAAAHEKWMNDPLLQLARAVGFGPILAWLREEFPDHPLGVQATAHPCETCVRLWREPSVATALRRRAELPENRAKTAALVELLFDETSMKESSCVP